jgi:hypothetical protein
LTVAAQALAEAFALIVAGHVTMGGVVSFTVTVKVHWAWLFD